MVSAANKELHLMSLKCYVVSRDACWLVPFQRNPQFVGRTLEIDRINAMLSCKTRCDRAAIVGLGGVGKTQIALEFAYQLREKQPDCSVFWIPVTSTESMLKAYVDIGQQLQIPNIEHEQEDVQKLIQRRLSQESSGKWLLVFDNADDIDIWTSKSGSATGSTRRIDYLPKSKHGSILFTTRNQQAAVKLAGTNVLSVDKMDDVLAKRLLEKSLIHQDLLSDSGDTIKLLQLLTFLPLAIVQASAYINENGITIPTYVALLQDTEQNIIDILSEEFEDEGRYEDIKNPIATTWLISFDQIRRRDPLAAEYLSFMACVDSKDIPRSLLPPAQSLKKAVGALGTLTAYSFITEGAEGQSFNVHRLVHLATRNWLRDQGSLGACCQKTINRLAEVFPNDDHENRRLWRSYLPHSRFALACRLVSRNDEGRLVLLEKLGLCLIRDGRYSEAKENLAEVMEMKIRTIGDEHPDTLTSVHNLATSLGNQGMYIEAEVLIRRALAGRTKVLGKEHTDTLTSAHSLGCDLWRQGRYSEAEALDRRTLEVREKVLGKEHPDTLKSVTSLAFDLWAQGKYLEAEALNRGVLEAREKVLGKDHPDTLTSASNLSWDLRLQGKFLEAEVLNRRALEEREKILGKEHPDTLASVGNLASDLRNLGKYSEAEALDRRVLEGREKILGKEHPHTLASVNNLASDLQNKGKYSEAEALDRRALEGREKILGKEHPDTLQIAANLAIDLRKQGKYSEAEVLDQRVREGREKKL